MVLIVICLIFLTEQMVVKMVALELALFSRRKVPSRNNAYLLLRPFPMMLLIMKMMFRLAIIAWRLSHHIPENKFLHSDKGEVTHIFLYVREHKIINDDESGFFNLSRQNLHLCSTSIRSWEK